MGNEPLTTDLLKRVVADAIAEATTLNRLAYSEPEAASLLGCRPHVLRDARLRGHAVEERAQRRQPAGGSADAHHVEVAPAGRIGRRRTARRRPTRHHRRIGCSSFGRLGGLVHGHLTKVTTTPSILSSEVR